MQTPGTHARIEMAYSDALTAIAMGATREETREALHSNWSTLLPVELDYTMADALRDALRQGVEREDIDPSWFGHGGRGDDGSNIVTP